MRKLSAVASLSWWQLIRLGAGVLLALLSMPFADLMPETRWNQWRGFVRRLADIEGAKRTRQAAREKLTNPAARAL